MNNEEKAIDVDYQDVGNEVYLTAPQMAQRINETETRVRYWADHEHFGKLIGTEIVNDRKRYKESEVFKYMFIKDLLDNKNMTHEQAKKYISKHGFKYAEFDSGLVNPKDPLGFEALASALSIKVDEKLKSISEEIISNVKNVLIEYAVHQNDKNTQLKAEIEASVGDIVTEKLEQTMTRVEEKQEELKDIVAFTIQEEMKSSVQEFKSHIDEREIAYQKKLQENEDRLKRSMELRELEHKKELEEQKNKSCYY